MFLQQLINALTIGSLYALTAMGATLIYGILGILDIANAGAYLVGGVAHDDVAERGLAGAVGTHEDMGLARGQVQADVVQDGLVLGPRREPANAEQRI